MGKQSLIKAWSIKKLNRLCGSVGFYRSEKTDIQADRDGHWQIRHVRSTTVFEIGIWDHEYDKEAWKIVWDILKNIQAQAPLSKAEKE